MAKKMTDKKTATTTSHQRKVSTSKPDECATTDVAGTCDTDKAAAHVHPAETKSEEHMRNHPRQNVDEARRRGESIDEETLDRSAPFNKTYGTNAPQKSENEHAK